MSDNTGTTIVIVAICIALSSCFLGSSYRDAARDAAKAEIFKACINAGKKYSESFSHPHCE